MTESSKFVPSQYRNALKMPVDIASPGISCRNTQTLRVREGNWGLSSIQSNLSMVSGDAIRADLRSRPGTLPAL